MNREADPEAATAAAEALGACAGAAEVEKLLRGLPHAPPRGRILAAAALGRTADPRGREALRRLLSEDGDPHVRAAAALALGPVADAEDVERLVRRGDLDTDPAARAACAEALEEATGERLGPDPAAWKKALGERGLRPRSGRRSEDGAPAPGQSVAADSLERWTVTYWGIPVTGDGTLFCFDLSGSMNYYERLGVAKRELLATISRLRSTVRFGVLFFNEAAWTWQARFVRALPLTKHALVRHLDEVEAKGYTDLLGMFERAFGLAGRGRLAAEAPERLRTLFLLTDGVPSRQFVRDLGAIRRAVGEWNPGRRVVLHAIGLGNADEPFLRALAEENRGRFVAKDG
ncbi:MAG: HEAT repeat domain-containing protein [Planctomycetales bacterium]|nr:HEAT repeat domain-containing protein [Planctomycetales bacterium]